MARELHQFLVNEGIRSPEIQSCLIGEAFVRFSTPLEHERFLRGPPHHFGQYHLSFIRHDEGMNSGALDKDRVVWLMLMCFPSDAARSVSLVSKSICHFATFQHLHPSIAEARIIVKALVHREHDISDSFVVTIGEGRRTRTFTIPVFILVASDLVEGGDEQPPHDNGIPHPLPYPAPQWMQPPGVNSASSNVMEQNAENNPNLAQGMFEHCSEQCASQGDDQDVNQNLGANQDDSQGHNADDDFPLEIVEPVPVQREDLPLFPAATDFEASGGTVRAEDFLRCDEDIQNIDVPDTHVDSVPAALGSGDSPAALVPLHSIIDKVLNNNSHLSLHSYGPYFANINQVTINLDTLIPSYLVKSDALWQLAKVLVDDAEPVSMNQDQEVVILDKMPPVNSPMKRRARKPRGPVDVKFLRRSSRLNKETQGFKDLASAEAMEVDSQ